MGAPDKHQLFSQAKIYSEENVWSRKLPLQFIGCTFLANPKPGLWSSLPPKKWKETCKYTKYTLLLRPISQVESVYTAISRKVVGKNVHATIPKGNMGYGQYTVPDLLSCRTYFCCFPLALTNILPRPLVNSKPPTIPFGIVACTFSDNLFRNSCICCGSILSLVQIFFSFVSTSWSCYYHTLPYPKTKEKKIWTTDKIEPQHIH